MRRSIPAPPCRRPASRRIITRLARWHNHISLVLVGVIGPSAILGPCVAAGYALTWLHWLAAIVAIGGAALIVSLRAHRERLLADEAEERGRQLGASDLAREGLRVLRRPAPPPTPQASSTD